MIDNPHQILGVAPGASQEEIKQAYRRKAKECHPDLHPNDPKANEKMNQVNEAYDMLMHPEKYQARQQQQQARQNPYQGNPYGPQGNPYGQQGNPYGQQGNPYSQGAGGGDWFDFDPFFGFGGQRSQYGAAPQPPREMPGDPASFLQAVRLINSKQFAAALGLLGGVPSAGRSARWYYLSALANHGAGNTMTATEQMERAVQLDPNNDTYHQLLRQYRQAEETYQENARGYNPRAMDPSKLCMGLCLANLFCRFFRCC